MPNIILYKVQSALKEGAYFLLNYYKLSHQS
jgi:hypothetical protein